MVEALRTGRRGTPCSLREERVDGVPTSFKKLNLFLRVRKRDLADYVSETCERRFEGTIDMGEEEVEGGVRAAQISLQVFQITPQYTTFH